MAHAEVFLRHLESVKIDEQSKPLVSFLCYITGHLAFHKSEFLNAESWFKKAELHLQNSVHRMTYLIQHAIGQIYLTMHRNFSDYEKVDFYLKEALEVVEKLYGKNSSQYASVLGDLARLHYDISNYALSKKYCDIIITICEENNLSKKSIAYTRHDLGMALCMLNKIDQAEAEYNESLKIKLLEYEHQNFPTIAVTKLGLGQIHYLRKNYNKAESLMIESLAISVKCFSHLKQHTGIAAAYNDLAATYFNQKHISKALSSYEESLRQYLALSNGEKNIDVAIVVHNLALIAIVSEKTDLASALLYHALHACHDSVGDGHKITMQIKKTQQHFLAYYPNKNNEVGNTIKLEDMEENFYGLMSKMKNSLTSPPNFSLINNIFPILSNRYGLFMSALNLDSENCQEFSLILSTD